MELAVQSYQEDRKGNYPPSMIPIISEMHAMVLEPEEAVRFLKNAEKEFLDAGHPKETHYWDLIGLRADAYRRAGMKEKAEKMWKKIRLHDDKCTKVNPTVFGSPFYRSFSFSLFLSLFFSFALSFSLSLSLSFAFFSLSPLFKF